MKKILIVMFILSILFVPMAYADEAPAYKLPNGRISVDEEVFNQLVTNDKKMEVYKEEVDYLKKSMEELKNLHKQGDNIQEQRILVLKDTISLKDQVIGYKDDNIKNWESLYNQEHKKVNNFKTMNIFEKILIAGMSIYACSEIDSTSGKLAVGTIGASLILLDW